MLPTYLLEASAHTGTMVALFVPAAVAKKLAVKGGLPPEELHITLAYLGKGLTDNQKAKLHKVVEHFAKSVGNIRVTLGGIGRFSASGTSEGKDVAYLSVDSPDITTLRPKLVSKLKAAGFEASSAHGFVPHVTLKYIGQSESMPMKRFEPVSFDVKKITLAVGGDHKAYKVLSESQTPHQPIVSVKRIGRDYHISNGGEQIVTKSQSDIHDALTSHLPTGFKPGPVMLHMASVRHGVPEYDHVDNNALHIIHPHDLAHRGVMGNELHPEHLSSIHQAWDEGKRLDPVTVRVRPDNSYWIEDGNHRMHAAAARDQHVTVQFTKVGHNWEPQRGHRDISKRLFSAAKDTNATTEATVFTKYLEDLHEALKDFDVSDTPEPRKKGTPPPIPAKALQPRGVKPPLPPAQAFKKAMAPVTTRIPRRLPGVGESLSEFVEQARTLIEGRAGKLQDYQRGSRGADSGRSFTKKFTSRSSRRSMKQQLKAGNADPKKRSTTGRAFLGWKPPQWDNSKYRGDEGPTKPRETLAQMKKRMTGEAKQLMPFSLSSDKVKSARQTLSKARQDAGYSGKADVNTKRKILLRLKPSED